MRSIAADLFDRDRPRWLRLATVLTGEPSAARTLLASATLRRPRRTDRDEPAGASPDDPEEADLRSDETARQLLLDTYLGRRLGWAPPLDEPDPPLDEPDPPLDEPDPPLDEPAPPLDEPDPPLDEPAPPLVEPVETTSPDPPLVEPAPPLVEPVETTPDPPPWAALTRRQRAALAMVCFEELTETEAARVLELTQPVVHADLAAALSALGLPAGRIGHERAGHLLRTVADGAPDTVGFGGEVRRQQASRRRFRSRVLAGATTLVVLVVAAVLVPEFVLYRVPVTPREPGELVHQFEVEPPEGWGVAGRGLNVETDYTYLSGAGTDTPSTESELCMVTAGARGVDPTQFEGNADRPAGEDVRIHGRPGQIHEGIRDATLLIWEFADEGIAAVRCTSDVPTDHVVKLAKSVRWRSSPVLVPFRWSADGPTGQVEGLSDQRSSQLAWITVGDEPEKATLMITLQETRLSPEGDPDGVVESPSGGLCRVQGSSALCAGLGSEVVVDEDGTQREPTPEEREPELALVRSFLADLELADLDDPDTWFDSRDAFPS